MYCLFVLVDARSPVVEVRRSEPVGRGAGGRQRAEGRLNVLLVGYYPVVAAVANQTAIFESGEYDADAAARDLGRLVDLLW